MSRLTRWTHERLAPLESHDVVTAAMRRTGSAELGDLEFSERLEVLCRSLQSEAGLHLAGRRAARAWCVDALSRRIEHDRAAAGDGTGTVASGANPDEESMTPHGIVVTGLAADLDAALAAALVGDGPRIDDEWLLRRDIASMAVEHEWHVPAFAELFDGADLTSAYRRLFADDSRVVTVGGVPRRIGWSVQHLERLTTIAEVGDDVVILIDVDTDLAASRIAEASVAGRRRHSDSVDNTAVARYWAWRCARLAERGVEQATAHPDSVVRVTAEALASSPDDEFRRISESTGVAWGDATGQPTVASLEALRRSATRWAG